MISPNLSRRDFLKLIGLTSLALIRGHDFLPKNGKKISTTQMPNVLILVFDALSARNMSLYGYVRNTTPNMERFASRANVYHRHYAGGNFTTPGTASLLTGAYPWTHRAFQMRDQTLGQFTEQNLFKLFENQYFRYAYTHNLRAYILLNQYRQHIDELLKISELTLFSSSLAEKFADPDYFIANESELLTLKSEYEPPGSMFLSIFDRFQRQSLTDKFIHEYKHQYPRGVPDCRPGKASMQCYLLEDAFDWLGQHLSNQAPPSFGYFHVMPPHNPYNPSKEFIGIFNDNWRPPEKPEHFFTEKNNQNKLNRMRRQYDEYIAYADAQFGQLYDFMNKTGILDNTYLIITSDHGEMFERGILGHVNATLYEPITHIPLLISSPGQSERIDIFDPTSAVDLFPTLAGIAGQQTACMCDGVTLPGFAGARSDPQRGIFIVEAKQNPKLGPIRKATLAVIRGDYKLIYYRGYPGLNEVFELYDIGNDPEELSNIYSPTTPVAISLRDELLSALEPFNP
jgi:arylsulfatase A-like enzyme